METKSGKVQYKLNLPPELYDSLKVMADEEGISVAQLLRRAIKWEMLADNVEKKGGRILIEQPTEVEGVMETRQIQVLA